GKLKHKAAAGAGKSAGDADQRMAIARLGQGATQAPQPVQSALSISGKGLPPRRGRKRIARTSQKSPQMRHSTPRRARQASLMMAWRRHGGALSRRTKALGWQALTQSPQKVHSARLKSTVGY